LSYHVLWFIPTAGDEYYLGSTVGRRAATPEYIRQIATALDSLGYYGTLLPTGAGCEDAWITAATLIPLTQQLRYLVALRPSLMLPAVSARMAATFDRLSNGRLIVNVVTGGGQERMVTEGVFGDEKKKYEVTDEFLTIWKNLLRKGEETFHGEHLKIEGGIAPLRPIQKPYPPVWFGGSSDEGIRVGAKQADVYLTWGEPPQQVAEKVARVRALAGDRKIRFGIRLHVVVRETEKEAWNAANNLISHLTDETIERAQAWLAKDGSEGQRRMQALHGGKRENLEVSPNLWAGLGLARPGAGTALVGSPEIIAERMREYAEIGIDTFILSGYPHLEEAYRFAELVFPLLPLAHETPHRATSAPRFAIQSAVAAN
jgi:alkanesulfonate monooxygenase